VGKNGASPSLFHHSVIPVQSAASAHFQIVVLRQVTLTIAALQLASTYLPAKFLGGLGTVSKKCLRLSEIWEYVFFKKKNKQGIFKAPPSAHPWENELLKMLECNLCQRRHYISCSSACLLFKFSVKQKNEIH